MDKKEFIKWLVKKQSRFVKTYRNSEDHWSFRKPDGDDLENYINLETDGKVIYINNKNLFGEGENSFIEKEFTYEEFVNTNIDELE